MPRTRSQIIRLCIRIASTSVEMLSSSASVANSVTLQYASRNGTAGSLTILNSVIKREEVDEITQSFCHRKQFVMLHVTYVARVF